MKIEQTKKTQIKRRMLNICHSSAEGNTAGVSTPMVYILFSLGISHLHKTTLADDDRPIDLSALGLFLTMRDGIDPRGVDEVLSCIASCSASSSTMRVGRSPGLYDPRSNAPEPWFIVELLK